MTIRGGAMAVHLGLLGVFCVFAYAGSLETPFVFDDLANIVFNPAVHPQVPAQTV